MGAVRPLPDRTSVPLGKSQVLVEPVTESPACSRSGSRSWFQHDERQVTVMTATVEITMTYRGFVVTTRGRTAEFTSLTDAFDFAQERIRLAQELSELSRRCE